MSAATLNGHRVLRARVTLPAWGAWHADVTLDTEQTLTGAVVLKVKDLELRGAVLSGGPSAGRSRYRIVAGAGGWGRTIKRTSYANDAGVKASTVLVDAAQACGETLDQATLPTTRLGPHWTREEGQARATLGLVSPGAWYVGEDGVTRLGARPRRPFTAQASKEPVDLAAGMVTLASETLAPLVPGAVVDGLEAVDVEHELSEGKTRTTLWGKRGTATSRRLSAYRTLIDSLFPWLRYCGTYEYRVVLLAGERLDLQPVRVSPGLPDLARVPVAAGVAGAKTTLVPGARVLVTFVDASPARPVVVGHEDADGDGFLPLVTEIDATTFVKLGAGVKPVIAAGDLAGGIWPCVPTQVKVLV